MLRQDEENMQGEIVVYRTDDGDTKIGVRFIDETVWLTQVQLVELFQNSKMNINEHIKMFMQKVGLTKSQLFGNSE